MAEISYPFTEDNSRGGTQVVSQTQWQAMAASWAPDSIDYRLQVPGETLPFTATVTNGRDVQISPGNAWVCGFYYQSTSPKTFTIAVNSTSYARKDLIVLRLDIAQSAVNMALRQGTAAASPTAPYPTRSRNGVWEMPLYIVDVPAQNGAPTLVLCSTFRVGHHVAVPWNAADTASLMAQNAFIVDTDHNDTGGQAEAYKGVDGYVPTRHLGKSQKYVPSLVNVDTSVPFQWRTGRWRWLGPNIVWFQVTIENPWRVGWKTNDSTRRMGIALPQVCNSGGIQVIHGYLSNPTQADGYPNLVAITATTSPKTTTLYLHYPNPTTPAAGLDGLTLFPGTSTLSLSGVYEANYFNE
ncbi:hypothetical protein [Streptomyces sp. NPDC046939]|uniref:hypothetical protein n=1 Tax=Streptomyces sp. NPDC046939 TaxID=3155376 RepID=UPI00340C6F16